MNIFKIEYYLFRKQFKITKYKNYLFLFTIFSFLIATQYLFSIPNNFEIMYKLKFLILVPITVPLILPSNNLYKKQKLKVFFGNLKHKEIDNYYSIKKYIITIFFIIYFFIPFYIYTIKLSLFYINVILLLYSVILILSNFLKYRNIQILIKLIQLLITWGFLIYMEEITRIEVSYYANKINIIFYLIIIFLCIYLSIYILKNLSYKMEYRINYINILKMNNFFDYNVLYVVRNKKFFNTILTFYISIFLLFNNISKKNIIFLISTMFTIYNLVNLNNIYKMEHNRFKIYFSMKSNEKLKLKKDLSLIKIYIINYVLIYPIILYKLGINYSISLFFILLIGIILSNIILTNLIKNNEFIINKDILFKYFIINILFIVLYIIII